MFWIALQWHLMHVIAFKTTAVDVDLRNATQHPQRNDVGRDVSQDVKRAAVGGMAILENVRMHMTMGYVPQPVVEHMRSAHFRMPACKRIGLLRGGVQGERGMLS